MERKVIFHSFTQDQRKINAALRDLRQYLSETWQIYTRMFTNKLFVSVNVIFKVDRMETSMGTNEIPFCNLLLMKDYMYFILGG